MSEWICTDGGIQWRKQLGEKEFQLIEIREYPNGFNVASGVIDLDDYTKEEITDCITGYGYESISDMTTQYGKDVNGVIAECLFEQESDMSLVGFWVETEEEAEKQAREYMKIN